MNSTKETEQALVRYYFLYRDLVTLHRQYKYGKAPRLSEGFIEKVCSFLFDLKNLPILNENTIFMMR